MTYLSRAYAFKMNAYIFNILSCMRQDIIIIASTGAEIAEL